MEVESDTCLRELGGYMISIEENRLSEKLTAELFHYRKRLRKKINAGIRPAQNLLIQEATSHFLR